MASGCTSMPFLRICRRRVAILPPALPMELKHSGNTDHLKEDGSQLKELPRAIHGEEVDMILYLERKAIEKQYWKIVYNINFPETNSAYCLFFDCRLNPQNIR